MTDVPQMEPVQWSGLRPAEGTGPRHYAGSEANAKAPWKCPACAAENTGLLGAGCSSCGNGGGAKHVGVDPIVVKSTLRTVREFDIQTPLAAANALPLHETPDTLSQAFWVFVHSRTPEQSLPDPFETFKAGWMARGAQVTPTIAGPDEIPTVQPVTDDQMLVGTARTRTILAALIFFKDQVLSQQPEEMGTGEWLTAEQMQTLIDELKEQP